MTRLPPLFMQTSRPSTTGSHNQPFKVMASSTINVLKRILIHPQTVSQKMWHLDLYRSNQKLYESDRSRLTTPPLSRCLRRTYVHTAHLKRLHCYNPLSNCLIPWRRDSILEAWRLVLLEPLTVSIQPWHIWTTASFCSLHDRKYDISQRPSHGKTKAEYICGRLHQHLHQSVQ